jgi:uncharacterized membrane protein YfcA
MELLAITLCTFFASLLTLYSGFGLGTLLMPVAALFFPVPTWRNINKSVALRFGIPALLASLPGAWLLNALAEYGSLFTYSIGGHSAQVTPVKLAAGMLLILFATAEIFPFLQRFNKTSLPAGGVLSGFFGGLSGHQGAFRSAFLIRAGLDKHQFVATNAAIASLVDIARLTVYAASFGWLMEQVSSSLLFSASIAAFSGAFLGVTGLKKITFYSIQRIVAVMLYFMGGLLLSGIV